ncbi:MAG: zinc ribbon domain-containing protein [Chloroflexota bacterium]|nr:zinc ribbon domain-containing protein [Chloroflexota bacterium]
MAIYEYRCERHGAFEAMRAIGTAPASLACPSCERQARRVFSAPLLAHTPPGLAAALDHAEKTRYEPDLVTSLPPADARRRTPVLPLTPTLRRLPRP